MKIRVITRALWMPRPAHMFEKATGEDIEEYAAKNLFAPLGIDQYFWKRTPLGLAHTVGGLYFERHDLAKAPTVPAAWCLGRQADRQSFMGQGLADSLRHGFGCET